MLVYPDKSRSPALSARTSWSDRDGCPDKISGSPRQAIEVRVGVADQSLGERQGDFGIAAGATGADHGFDAGPGDKLARQPPVQRSPPAGPTAPANVCLRHHQKTGWIIVA
jgi:hypothetical protein